MVCSEVQFSFGLLSLYSGVKIRLCGGVNITGRAWELLHTT